MTFLDHIGSTEKNGFYHFLFLSLMSNRSENLMKRSSAANQFLKRNCKVPTDWFDCSNCTSLKGSPCLQEIFWWTKRLHLISYIISFPRIRTLLYLCSGETGRQKHAAFHVRLLMHYLYNLATTMLLHGWSCWHKSNFSVCLTVRYKLQ